VTSLHKVTKRFGTVYSPYGPFPRIGKTDSAPLALVFLSLALTRNKELDTADILETPLERFDGE
jgi:hypothetical protein